MRVAAALAPFIVAIAASTHAQADGASDIEACRTNSASPEDRIACLEAALLRRDESATAEEMLTADASADDDADIAPEASTAPEVEVAELGAEQVRTEKEIEERQKKKKAQKVVASVTDLARSQNGQYIFFLDNGQIWRQKRSDSNTMTISRRPSYDAEVSRGAISGYRLKLSGIRRSFAVERVK